MKPPLRSVPGLLFPGDEKKGEQNDSVGVYFYDSSSRTNPVFGPLTQAH